LSRASEYEYPELTNGKLINKIHCLRNSDIFVTSRLVPEKWEAGPWRDFPQGNRVKEQNANPSQHQSYKDSRALIAICRSQPTRAERAAIRVRTDK